MAQKSSSRRRVVASTTTDRIELLLKILLLRAQASCLKLFGNMAPKGKAKARARRTRACKSEGGAGHDEQWPP